MLQNCPKKSSTRTEIMETIEQMERNLKEKHNTELKQFEEKETETIQEGVSSLSFKFVERKPSKAQHKKAQKEAREEARAREAEGEKKNVIPSRNLEMEKIKAQLLPLNLQIKEIPADGNCLFTAIADQIAPSEKEYFRTLRSKAAEYIHSHPNEFLPFIDIEEYGPNPLKEYCEKLRGTASWGGQLELEALVNVLETPIRIFAADSPVIRMGEQYQENPSIITLTYHKHMYVLGEHYNSVKPFNVK